MIGAEERVGGAQMAALLQHPSNGCLADDTHSSIINVGHVLLAREPGRIQFEGYCALDLCRNVALHRYSVELK